MLGGADGALAHTHTCYWCCMQGHALAPCCHADASRFLMLVKNIPIGRQCREVCEVCYSEVRVSPPPRVRCFCVM